MCINFQSNMPNAYGIRKFQMQQFLSFIQVILRCLSRVCALLCIHEASLKQVSPIEGDQQIKDKFKVQNIL